MSAAKPRTLSQIIAAMQAFTHPNPLKDGKPADLTFVWVDYPEGRLRLRATDSKHLAEFTSLEFRDGRDRGSDIAAHEVALAPGGYFGADLAKRVTLMKHDMITTDAPRPPIVAFDRILRDSAEASKRWSRAGLQLVHFDATLLASALTATSKLFRDKFVPMSMHVPPDNVTPLRFEAKDAWGELVVVVMPVRMP